MKEDRRRLTPLRALPIMLLLAAAARGLGYLYVILSSDIVYMGTPLPDALYVLSELADVAMLFLGYGLTIRGVKTISDGAPLRVSRVLLPLAVSALGVAVSYIFSFLVYSCEYVGIDYGALALSLLLNLLAELVRLILVTGVSLLVFFVRRRKNVPDRRGFSPFASSAGISLFCASAILLLSRGGVELFGTTLPFFAEYTDVTKGEMLTVAFTYLSMVFHAVIGYFIGFAAFHLSAPESEKQNL